ncbi:MAG: nuclear transport factor 2 family protein [Betaproteobacteria bacterium]
MPVASEKDILALEARRYAAMIALDEAELGRLFGDDLIYVHSSGAVDTKASYIHALRTGKFRYTKCERFEEKVRLYGDTALVTGRAVFEALTEGAPKTLRLRYLNVWAKGAEGWRLVGWQSCPLLA